MAELTERVQALPPELFNQIRNEVINTEPDFNPFSPYKRITAQYKFPKQLHIDKRTRQLYAYKHLNRLTFVFTCPERFREYVIVMAQAGFPTDCKFDLIIPHNDDREFEQRFLIKTYNEASRHQRYIRYADQHVWTKNLIEDGGILAGDECLENAGGTAAVLTIRWVWGFWE